jgi:hypothetical protein
MAYLLFYFVDSFGLPAFLFGSAQRADLQRGQARGSVSMRGVQV